MSTRRPLALIPLVSLLSIFLADVAGASSSPREAALKVLRGSDCLACHAEHSSGFAPAFAEVSKRYRDDKKARRHLTDKIRRGGAGAWGKIPMPAHPELTRKELTLVVDWVLSL